MRTVTPELAQKGIFLGDYTKTRFTNLSDMIDDDMTSADEKKSTNYDIAQKAGTLKDNLIVGHSIMDRQFTFGYVTVYDNGKNYIEIVAKSDKTITVPVCYFISSKSAIMRSTDINSLMDGIKSVGFSSRGSAKLPKLFEKGHAFFLNSPTFKIDDIEYEIIPDQVVSENSISTLLNAINKRSKRSYYVDGPGSEFYIRCKMFKNGEVSLKRDFKYKAEDGQSLAEWEDVIQAKEKEKAKKKEEKNPETVAEVKKEEEPVVEEKNDEEKKGEGAPATSDNAGKPAPVVPKAVASNPAGGKNPVVEEKKKKEGTWQKFKKGFKETFHIN